MVEGGALSDNRQHRTTAEDHYWLCDSWPRYRWRMCSYARRRGVLPDDVHDVVQDAFVRLMGRELAEGEDRWPLLKRAVEYESRRTRGRKARDTLAIDPCRHQASKRSRPNVDPAVLVRSVLKACDKEEGDERLLGMHCAGMTSRQISHAMRRNHGKPMSSSTVQRKMRRLRARIRAALDGSC